MRTVTYEELWVGLIFPLHEPPSPPTDTHTHTHRPGSPSLILSFPPSPLVFCYLLENHEYSSHLAAAIWGSYRSWITSCITSFGRLIEGWFGCVWFCFFLFFFVFKFFVIFTRPSLRKVFNNIWAFIFFFLNVRCSTFSTCRLQKRNHTCGKPMRWSDEVNGSF